MFLRFRQLWGGKSSNCTARLPFWSTKKHKVATTLFSYERYGEILFQKVASGYLLHFVQDGSSKKRTIKLVFVLLCNTFLFLFLFFTTQNIYWGFYFFIFPPLTPIALRRALFGYIFHIRRPLLQQGASGCGVSKLFPVCCLAVCWSAICDLLLVLSFQGPPKPHNM